jgi:hypothetical protein
MSFIITSTRGGALNRIPAGTPKLNPNSYQAKGLVGWWPGNVDAGQVVVRDYSEHDNHATWTTAGNGPQTEGAFNSIVPLNDGTTDVPVGDAIIPALQGAANASLCIWFRRTITHKFGGIGYGVDSSNRFHLAVWSSPLIYGTINGGFDSITQNDILWHHGVITFDGTAASTADRVKLYIDGQQNSLSSASYPTALSSSASNRICMV